MPRTAKKRGGYVKLDTCEYNLYDNNARVNSEDAYELQGVYNTCCPKTRLGLKNSAPFCKNLANQFKMLQGAKNYETKQVFKSDSDKYLSSEDDDYYKPRNAIISPTDEEFGDEFKGPVYEIGGKSKSKKSKKSKKSNKSKKSKKSKKCKTCKRK